MNFDRETLIARFLESDTHSTLQLITPAENLKKITPIFENLEIRKVTHTEIPETINNL